MGTGVAGLVCAHLLHPHHRVTVFESQERPGGHTNTVTIELGPHETHQVDTGFIVFNHRNYPGFLALLDELGIPTQPSDMSMSVSGAGFAYGLYRGGLFADRRNLARPRHHLLLASIIRFHRNLRHLLGHEGDSPTLREVAAGYSDDLRERYLVPLCASLWSMSPRTCLDLPAVTFARFMDLHALVRPGVRPKWMTIPGGARRYVDAILRPMSDRVRLGHAVRKVVRRSDGVELVVDGLGPRSFDQVVLACHTDQALELLGDPTPAEREVLGAIPYQRNEALLHSDTSMLPANPRLWASWNALVPARPEERVTITYRITRLARLNASRELLVTLNRSDVSPEHVLGELTYEHPVYTRASVRAQQRWDEVNGTNRTWYAGAWWGYGFHEDGIDSALRVVRALGVRTPLGGGA